MPDHGFATYRLHIKMDQPRVLALRWSSIWSSAKIFVDGQDFAEIGKVAEYFDPELYQPRVTDQYRSFTPQSNEFDIIIQAASYEFFLAGLAYTPSLGTPEAIIRNREKEIFIAVFLVGSLFIMAMYHFCLFLLRTKARSTLYFGLVCLIAAIYMLAAKGRAYSPIVPTLSYPDQLRLFNVWILALPAFSYFTYELFPRLFSKRVAQLVAICIIPLFAYVLINEPRDFVVKTLFGQAVGGVLGLYVMYISIKAIKVKEEGASIFFGGALIVILTATHDMLMTVGLFESVPLGSAGLFLFIFFQSLLLARRFSNSFSRVEISEQKIRQLSCDLQDEHDQVISLNQNLESMVDEQTREIRSIMTHIQLGIFAITGNQYKIHKDYSLHLRLLFEREELADLNACEILFDGSNLSSDESSQAINTIESSILEDPLVFATNAHCLPKEIVRRRKNGTKSILELSWNPVINDQQITEKVLVTVRDVTKLRDLEEDASEKKEELEFISELINVAPEAFRRFIDSCHEFINENRKLMNSESIREHDIEVLKVLFINMHTMKGAARSFYFKRMTNIFHEVEQYYAVLQKDPRAKWDIEKMKKDLLDVEIVVKTYETVNRDKLGRNKNEDNEVEFSISQVLGLYQDLSQLGSRIKSQVDVTNLQLIRHMKELLFPKIHAPVQNVLEDICQCLSPLAKDLEKAKPILIIEAQNSYVNRSGENLLRKIFVHILRNSMDHGLEKALERRQKGKPENGTISIILTSKESGSILRYEDDGRGLDIEKIRLFAKRQQLADRLEERSPEDIAPLIFHSGLSTAKRVNDISGRGVGMDAVKRYLAKEGGEISIQLKNDRLSDGNYPFYFEIYLPHTLFVVTHKDDLDEVA